MQTILNAPALLKVFTSLMVILLFNRVFKRITPAFFLGATVLAFWSGHSPGRVVSIAWQQLNDISNIFFLAVILLVIWLSYQMAETGVMKDMVKLLRSRVSKRMSMAILPALIGFLPMPGGALFSAPLVDDCDREDDVPPMLKTRINYWFRHVWEYWWPLYPGVLLAVELTGLSIPRFIMLQFPLCLFSILSGYLFLLRRIPETAKPRENTRILFKFLNLILPILLLIAGYALLKILLPPLLEHMVPALASKLKYLPICLGIIIGIITLQIQRPLPAGKWRSILLSPKPPLLVLLVAAVQIYGAFIAAPLPDGGFLSVSMKNELAAAGFPLLLTLAIIPFICGIVTGLAVGFVGASFPIVLSLIGPDPSHAVLLGTIVLAYGCGYMGMILSPVHICLIVTNGYFKTKLEQSLLYLIKPALGVLGGIILHSWVVRMLAG